MTSYASAVARLREEFGELIARHERARDLDEFTRYADNPVAFIREVLRGEPWSAQEEIARAVRDHPLVVVRGCNSSGKDWAAGHLALWWVYARRGLVLITGPTERQVREIVMGEVGRAWAKAEDLPGELYQLALRLGRDQKAGILAATSTDVSRLTGHHAARVLAIVTEAQAVPSFTFEAALANATGTEDRILAVGNPLAPSGFFFDASRAPDWHAIRISAHDFPNVRDGREVIPGGITREGVERIRRQFGEDSGVYRARVLGEFPDQAVYGLVRRSWLEAAVDRFRHHGRDHALRNGRVVVAVDPARFGPDLTAVAFAEGHVLVDLITWAKRDTMQTVEALRRELAARSLFPSRTRFVVDDVGVGAGVIDRLRQIDVGWGFEQRQYAIVGFNGGRRASRAQRFENLRAESFWHLRKKLEDGKLALKPDDDLFRELVEIQWGVTPTGRVKIEAKDELRQRLGRSIDRADAVSMAFSLEARGSYASFTVPV